MHNLPRSVDLFYLPMHRLVLPLFVAILGVATVHGFLVSPVLRSRKVGRNYGVRATTSSADGNEVRLHNAAA